MRFAGQRMPRFRADSGRTGRARQAPETFEYRDGLRIVNSSAFPPAKGQFNPDIGLPTGMEGIMTNMPEVSMKVSVPTRIGTLG